MRGASAAYADELTKGRNATAVRSDDRKRRPDSKAKFMKKVTSTENVPVYKRFDK
jgi:hypothetical protein